MSGSNNLHTPKKGYRLFSKKNKQVMTEGLWHNNPIFGMVLGLCSTLAVTNLVKNTLVMTMAVLLVLMANSAIISAIRNFIPDKVRMIAYMLITSTLVIAVDIVLKLFLPDISKAMGAYVALIITNCIIMGRAEAFAASNSADLSVVDAMGVGLGYAFSLLIISVFRELIGFGTLFGFQILPDSFEAFSIFTIPPGAFFSLGAFILVINIIKRKTGGEK
jgi:Na+-transporting NADH:ubiquinone oxidoreductase subunit D